jgi:hypothetical protein
MLRRSEPQEGTMKQPISHIEIEASSSINPLLDLLGKMGMAENNNLKPFQKFSVGKGLEGGGRGGLMMAVMIFLVTHVAHPLGNPAGKFWPHILDESIGPSIFENSSEGSVSPLLWIR